MKAHYKTRNGGNNNALVFTAPLPPHRPASVDVRFMCVTVACTAVVCAGAVANEVGCVIAGSMLMLRPC